MYLDIRIKVEGKNLSKIKNVIFFFRVPYIKSTNLRGDKKNYLSFKRYYYFYFKIFFKKWNKKNLKDGYT